jgi:transposase-like protein
MGKKTQERRVYTREFKAEAVAPAEKREKPIIQVARDLGIGDTVLHRWIQQAREAAGEGLLHFPDTDGPGMRNRPGCGRKSKRSGVRMKS